MDRKKLYTFIVIFILAVLAVLVVGYIGDYQAEKSNAQCGLGFSIGKLNCCYQWTQTTVSEYNGGP